MKRNYWPIFFILIFGFTFSMIVWTIKSASSISLAPDKSFMKKYQDVDAHFNEMMESNKLFPIFLKLESINILVVGGGKVALEKMSAIKTLCLFVL